jgi:hypothetical protein
VLKNFIIRKGLVKGQSIVLETATGLSDDQLVWVGIAAPDGEGKDSASVAEEVAQEMEAAQALETIHRMRQAGRSIREL